MMRDLTLGQYVPGNSVVHKVDPRMKIIVTAVFMAAIFFIDTFLEYAALIMFVLSLMLFSGIAPGYFFRGIRPLIFIIAFTAFINIFFTRGREIMRIWTISVTMEGVSNSVEIILRLVTLVIVASALILTTSPLVLAQGIERLLLPLSKAGLPVREFSMMIMIALRFIPVLLDETEKIMKAQAARGAEFDTGSLLTRAKSFIPVLVPLFISSFRRADDLAVAMESRCYSGGEKRTSMNELKFSLEDIYAAVYVLIFIAALAVL